MDLLCESGGCGRTGTIHYRNRWYCPRCVEELDGQLGLPRKFAFWVTAGTGVGIAAIVLWVLIAADPTPGLWVWAAIAALYLMVAARFGHKENQ